MMNTESELTALKQILQRERKARREAEFLLASKNAELQKAQASLLVLNRQMDEMHLQRTKEVETNARFARANPDPIVCVSFDGHVLTQNPSAELLLQTFAFKGQLYNAAAFWKQLVTEIDRSQPYFQFEAACGDKLFSFTCAMHLEEGHVNIYGCDVTEQRRALQALEESEQKWHFVLKTAGDGIWEYDLQTKETTFSRSYKELLGFEKDAFLNQERLWRSRIHPEDLHLIDTIIEEYAAGKRIRHNTQYRIRKRTGNYIWILDRGVLLARTQDNLPLKIIGVHTNINQQKELELNFKSTVNRLSTLIANLHMGVIMENEEGDALVTNKKMCDILGLDYERQKRRKDNLLSIARQMPDLFHESAHFLESLQKNLQAQKPVFGEIWEMMNGRFIRRNFIPVYSHEGHFQGNLWVIEDITEQIDNERALKQQRRFYEHILNNIPADVAVFDADQQFLFLNPVALKDELLRNGVFSPGLNDQKNEGQMQSSAFDERNRKFAQLLGAKRMLSWEEEVIRSNGNKEYSLRSLYPVLDSKGEVDMVIGYGLNITERKQIEQRIQLSEKRYRDLINFSYALIITHDTAGTILTVNPSVCRALGYTYAELIGKPLGDFMLPADAEKIQSEYLRRIVEESLAEGVFRVVSKEGKIIYLLYKNYLFLEDGQSPYIIGFAQDISERVKAEKELKLAKKATEQAAIAKERFLADMSHEIRTPMNGILGLASLLERTALDTKQKEHLGLLKESANNLLMIVNDVLDLEKVTSGKMELERIAFPVWQKVESAVASFRFKIEEKGLSIRHHNHLPPGLLVMGDPYRLSQILNNLVSNALKFTSEGSITVETKLLSQKENRVLIEFTVTDTGIGIPTNKLQQIFNPYMQARPEISRKYGGTGLGLAISKSLVEIQQGTIHVESTEGQGSSFLFSIAYDVADTAGAETNTIVSEEDNLVEGLTILVAEDVQINQYLIKHFFSGLNCTLHFVDNGHKAVEEVSHTDYDLVLMDIQMPEMDGMEATRAIRAGADKKKASVPVIALTANALKGADAKYLAAGMDNYLSKPYTKEKLLNVIRQTMKQCAERIERTTALVEEFK